MNFLKNNLLIILLTKYLTTIQMLFEKYFLINLMSVLFLRQKTFDVCNFL